MFAWFFRGWTAKVAAAKETPSGKILIAAGFTPLHTGAGCSAWTKGDLDGLYAMIGDIDAGLGENVDVFTGPWLGTICIDDDDRQADFEAPTLTIVIDWCNRGLEDPHPFFAEQERECDA